MNDFDDIRPYNDDEVRPALERLCADTEFLDTLAKWKHPILKGLAPLVRPLVRRAVHRQCLGIASVNDFQMRVENYLSNVIETTTSSLTSSGLDRLQQEQSYCFISNHRDIAMDSAFINWCLFHNGFQTLRIAIGDNLLTKPFASDLMRLNKSFIVKRSATGPREKLKAAKKLSQYIHHSLVNDNNNIWIAQREGRAKDGNDKTNPAILSMLALNKAKPDPLADYVRQLRIVPVSISYEFDPCDESKARELYLVEKHGSYKKQEHEDVASIAYGITGYKGAVHIAFGAPLAGNYESTEDVMDDLDRAVWRNYVLHPTNCIAYEMLEKKVPEVPVSTAAVPYDPNQHRATREVFRQRVMACDVRWRDYFVRAYANPVYAHLSVMGSDGA